MRKKQILRKRINKRFIPNIFTVLNMFLGFSAIILIISGDPVRGAWFVFAAAMLDAFDGKLARMLGIESTFGAEFDSFADTVSFCVTSSLLIYTTWVNGLHPLIAVIFSFVPIFFGTIRLAKFNLISEDNPKPYFIGLTTPLYALTLFGFILFLVSNQNSIFFVVSVFVFVYGLVSSMFFVSEKDKLKQILVRNMGFLVTALFPFILVLF